MRIRNKKSQVALEFLTTYGWVILIVLAAIAVLTNYGFLNPSKYLPERVEFTEQLKCEEYFMDTDANGENLVALIFRNNFGRSITIHNLYAKSDDDFNDCNIAPVENIGIGETAIVACTDLTLNSNVKNDINFIITFSRNVTDAIPHNVSGLIFAEAVEGEYCDQPDPYRIEDYIHCRDNVHDCDDYNGYIDRAPSCGDNRPPET